MATKTKKRSANIFVSYFSDFGLKQIGDLLMLGGAVVLIVGLCLNNILIAIGLSIYIAATLIALFRSIRVLADKNVKKRSPEYKRAFVNTVIMSVILALAVFALIWAIIY